MADLNFTLGLSADALIRGATQSVKALDSMNARAQSLGRKLQEQEILMTEGAGAAELYRIATAKISDAEKVRLLEMAKANQQMQAQQAAEKDRIAGTKELQAAWEREAAAAKKKQQAIKDNIDSLQQEAAMLGKTAAQQKLFELRTQGATAAQLKQAQAALAQIEAHNRVNARQASGGMMGGGVSAMVAGAAGIVGVGSILNLADQWTVLNNRLKLVTSSSAELKAAQQGLLDIATRTGADLGETANVYSRLAAHKNALRLNDEQLLSVTETINKAISVGGSTAAGAAAGLQQFGQAMAAGVLRGEEFNSVMENAPGLAQALASGLGVGVGQLRAMANAGELTAGKVTQALLKAGTSVDALFAQTDLTIAGATTNFKTKMLEFVGTASEAGGAADKIASAINWAAKHIDTLATAATVLIGVSVTKWLVGAAAGMVQYGAALLTTTSAAGASAGANAALAASVNTVGVRAALASFQVTGFSGALAVLRTAATAAVAPIIALLAPLAPAVSVVAAVASGITAIVAAVKFFRGEDSSNIISRGFDGLLDKIGILDSKTETLGTKFYDWFHPIKKAKDEVAKLNQELSITPMYASITDKLNGKKQSAQNGALGDDGVVAVYKAAAMKTEDLEKSLQDMVVKYKEQAASVGKSTEELDKLRLAAEKTALLEKKKAEITAQFNNESDVKKREELIAKTYEATAAKIEQDFREASAAIDAAEAATKRQTDAQNAQTEALKRAKLVTEGLQDLRDQLERVGKSATELKLMDLKNAGASAEQLAEAKSLLNAIAAKEKAAEAAQNKLGQAGDTMQSAADTMQSAARQEYKNLQQRNAQYAAQAANNPSRSVVSLVAENRRADGRDFDTRDLNKAVEQSQSGIQSSLKNMTTAIQYFAPRSSAGMEQAASKMQAALQTPQTNTPQAQDMGRVTLDLRAPDGKQLTGVLFGSVDFLTQFKAASYKAFESYISDAHAALT